MRGGACWSSLTKRLVGSKPRPARQLELLLGRKLAYTSTSIGGQDMPTVYWIGLFMGSSGRVLLPRIEL
jgi:hypothetical protein